MARWEQNPRGRLLRSAIDLFTDHGYEATTAAQIAAGAGLTKTTLFRHFADKREILFQGQDAQIAAAIDAVETAPAAACALDLLRAGIFALCGTHTADHRETGRRLAPLLAQSAELQERANFKRSATTQALENALSRRLEDPHLAGMLADIGMRAYYEGFAAWIASTDPDGLDHYVNSELVHYETALHRLGQPG